jgi:hypothetical protein
MGAASSVSHQEEADAAAAVVHADDEIGAADAAAGSGSPRRKTSSSAVLAEAVSLRTRQATLQMRAKRLLLGEDGNPLIPLSHEASTAARGDATAVRAVSAQPSLACNEEAPGFDKAGFYRKPSEKTESTKSDASEVFSRLHGLAEIYRQKRTAAAQEWMLTKRAKPPSVHS